MILKKSIEFILFSSLFIACCAVGLCIETNLLLHVALNTPSFYLFVLGATLLQYNLHYYLKLNAIKGSLRMAWSLRNKTAHLVLITVGVILILISLFSFHLHHFIFLLILGIIAFLYSFPALPFTQRKRIKDFGLLKISTLALLWTLVTVWFPVDQISVNGLSFQLVFFRRFIFIFILCLLFDIRDVEVDFTENIRTMPVIIGIRSAYVLCYVLLAIFVLLTLVQFLYIHEKAQLFVMLISALATYFTIEYCKKNNSDFVYLACVDGMMLLQAVMVILTSI